MHEELLWGQLRARLAHLVTEFAGVAGIAILDLTHGEEVGINADELFPTASSIKIHILLQLLLRAERGELDLTQSVKVDPNEIVMGSGVLAQRLPTSLVM